MELGKTDWILLGTHFRCLGVPADAQADTSALLQGFARPAPGAQPDLELRFEDLAAGGAPISSLIEYRLVNEAISRARNRYVLHAGAVEGPRGTCLLLGESGAGKTSLTLWLWQEGHRLVTDDLCPLAHGSLLPERFPRALHMDAEYSPLLVARIPPRPPGYPVDYYPFPERAGSPPPPPPPITHLVVIERGPLPEGEITPLGQSEAAHHLLRAVIKQPGFELDRTLEDMVRLAAGCQAYRLRSGTPEGAGAKALGLLGSVS
jgi:hypothetical protein